jgi:putative acetyltransferase
MLRTERPGDMLPVYELVSAAFGRPDEAELVNRLRECGAAVVTMVEEEEYEFMGHLMLSPITIEGQEGPWLGLAPVAVHPDWQGQGIGSDLVREGLDTALEMDWKAVVVLGDPAYYARFGFRPALHLRGVDGVFHGDGVATRRARRGKGRGALSPPVR